MAGLNDESPATLLDSLCRLEDAPAAERDLLLAVIDMARGYLPPRLVSTSRILPAVQPRFDAEVLSIVEPIIGKAREVVERWQLGRIDGAVISAQDETRSLLSRARELSRNGGGRGALHQSLVGWLEGRSVATDAAAYWQDTWAAQDVFSAMKKPWLLDCLRDLDRHDRIGRAVLDVGSGRTAASDVLMSPMRRVAQVDRAAAGQKDGALLLQADIEDAESRDLALQRAMEHAGAPFDTIICSQLLNYVDYRALIEALQTVHHAGGRLIIFNQPFEGEADFFSLQGARDNLELLSFLDDAGYVVEILLAAPHVYESDYDHDLRAKSLLIAALKRE